MLSDRVRQLELLLHQVATAQGIDTSMLEGAWAGGRGVSAQVRLLKQQGKKIAAIKLVREQTGLGLKDAQDVVDRS